MKIVEKPWGREVIYAHEPEYVGKILEVKKGEQLSLQYHREKKETMYLLSGKVWMFVDGKTLGFSQGDAITIEPTIVHRVMALEDTVILEVSTPHLDDVVRLHDIYNREVFDNTSVKR